MRISDWSSDVCSSDLKGVYGVRCLTYRTRLPLATLPSPEPRPARMAERPPPAPVGLRSDLRQAWISAGIAAALALLALVGVFWDTAATAVDVWISSKTYNHCFLIVPIVAYLLWDRRPLFSQVAPRPFWWGLRSEEHTSELQSLMRISYA